MSKNNRFFLLTLASNDQKCVVAKDNISFASIADYEDEQHKKIIFTRVYLKQLDLENESKWVDVKETPEEIFRM